MKKGATPGSQPGTTTGSETHGNPDDILSYRALNLSTLVDAFYRWSLLPITTGTFAFLLYGFGHGLLFSISCAISAEIIIHNIYGCTLGEAAILAVERGVGRS